MNRSYDISKIKDIVGGELVQESELNSINNLLIDSRKIAQPKSSLFVAIKGTRNDGHRFIGEAYKLGVRNFLIENEIDLSAFPEANFLKTNGTLSALQNLAAYHRQQFDFPIIGITGSNGKTIVKEWLYQLLRKELNIVRSPKSYNSQVGCPLSVWQCAEDHQMGIFEAGISQAGEMSKLKDIIQPSIGLFTNIGQAHDENFDDWEDKVEEKLKLFDDVNVLIYCRDFNTIQKVVSESKYGKLNTFTWSKKTRANLQVGKVEKHEHHTVIQAVYKNDFIRISIPFTDEASIENGIHCWAVMLYLGYDNDFIAERMAVLSPVAMRLELNAGINNCSIIDDTYNSDLGSLAIALDFLNQQKHHNKRTVILSDILQSGQSEEDLYQKVSTLLTEKNVDRLIGIGSGISNQNDKFGFIEASFYSDTSEFLKSFNANDFKDETILLKGARSFGFEDISKLFQQKVHETVVEVNLNSIIHNYNFFKSKVDPNVKLMAMVKAFSYGSGSFEIANTLEFHRADYLGVAYIDEGVELRKAGITLPIMIMNPEQQGYDSMIHYRLEPEIYNFRVYESFEKSLNRNLTDELTEYPIHIKLDTGMHRLGFEEDEINSLIIKIKNNKHIKIQSVFSHLAASDDPIEAEFTQNQIDLFERLAAQIQSHFDYKIDRHILNSSGILSYPQGQFEMVRLGIGMYGISSEPKFQDQLQPASTLKTTISQIKQVQPGESVGYNRRERVYKETTIATVPIGYADGLWRTLSNRKGHMLVNGQLAPIVGNVCMDMCMLDITGINAEEGDEVIVFGDPKLTLQDFAKSMGTIPYEALTSISPRVKRVYFQE